MLSPVLGKRSEIFAKGNFHFTTFVYRHEKNNHNLSQQRVESQRPAFQKAADLSGKQRLGLLNGRETKRHPPLQEIYLTSRLGSHSS